MSELLLSNFTEINSYEDCPSGVDLIVWTGDSWQVEHVEINCDSGDFYPANGIHFTHYAELPSLDIS